MHYLFWKLLLKNPPLKNPNINIGALKCCLAMYLSFDFMFLYTYCVCMHVCAQMYTVVYMRTPEDSVWELVLFQHLEREVKLRLSGLAASTIISWAILPSLFLNKLPSIWKFTELYIFWVCIILVCEVFICKFLFIMKFIK